MNVWSLSTKVRSSLSANSNRILRVWNRCSMMFNCEMARQYSLHKECRMMQLWHNYILTKTVICNSHLQVQWKEPPLQVGNTEISAFGILPLGVVNGAMCVSVSFLWSECVSCNAWELRILQTVMCATSYLVQSHGLRARNNDLNSLTESGLINTCWSLCTKISNLSFPQLTLPRLLSIQKTSQ